MLNTVIVDFYLDHTKYGIIKLEQEGVIKIKFWLTAENYKTENNMYSINDINKFSKEIYVPEEAYCKIRDNIYFFINIHSRWSDDIEIADYVHDFNTYIKFWYNLFKEEKIELFIMGNAPHAGFNYVGYLVAKAMKIKIIITEQILQLENRFMCCKDIERFGKRDFRFRVVQYNVPKIEKKFKKDLFYMKNIKPIQISKDKPIIQYLNKNFLVNFKNKYKEEGRLFPYFLIKKIGLKMARLYSKKYFKKHGNDLCKIFDENKNYIYFPLHFQPEMTTDTLGGIYEDQLLAIERLTNIIPKDWLIYVKENPMQTYYKRSKKFFKRLDSIKNVYMVKPDTNTYDLIKNSQFVATITGTAGWEAITGGKNALIFGAAWYRTLPGVFEYSENIDYKDIVSYKIDHAELEKEFNEFYQTALLPGVVAGSDFKKLNPEFTSEKNNEYIFNSLKIAIDNY